MVEKLTDDWLLRYVVAVETTMIVSMLSFWFAFYPGLATQAWVKEVVVERPPILAFMPDLVGTVKENKAALGELQRLLPEQLRVTNERLYRIEVALGIDKQK